jgi:hypothetical protein
VAAVPRPSSGVRRFFHHEQAPNYQSGYVTENYLASLARRVSGLNLARWNEEDSDEKLATHVTQGEQLARAT